MNRTTLLLTYGFVGATAFAWPALAADTVTAIKAAAAPDMKAGAADPAWAKAEALSVQLSGGANFNDGKTTATIKAVYVDDMLYMLLQYDDPTQSVRRSPYQKQADGSWKKLADPSDAGGNNNLYYEDKFAMIWNINNSIKGFSQLGCMAACHMGEPGKPYGNKYLSGEGELGDLWHMKSIRTGYIGQADDQYLDHTRYNKDVARYQAHQRQAGIHAQERIPANQKGGTYYLRAEDKAPFDDSKFKPGDEVASILVAPFAGDRGDIAAAIAWNSGKWTTVLSRKLVTGSKYDVQFDNLDGVYEFGFAAFDNAQVRHAFHIGALKLKFAK